MLKDTNNLLNLPKRTYLKKNGTDILNISSELVRISSAIVEISSAIVEISSELVQFSSELVSTIAELLRISTFRNYKKKHIPNA